MPSLLKQREDVTRRDLRSASPASRGVNARTPSPVAKTFEGVEESSRTLV
jgi:hypothetical protein